jgi:putative glutamine amidotransferase
VTAPLILIVGRLSAEAKAVRGEAFASGQRYHRAIERAGGIPLMLAPLPALLDERLDQLIERIDGVLFHGGGDVSPSLYGQVASAKQLYGIVPEHDQVELALMRAAIAADLPVLGLCRGLQVLNVACGGTLQQDIGTEEHWMHFHPVELASDSKLAAAFGTSAPQRCHSVHHQAIDRLGTGLRIVGHAPDGMVEAVELEGASWVVATQWHPEDNAETDSEQQNVFNELVRVASSARIKGASR